MHLRRITVIFLLFIHCVAMDAVELKSYVTRIETPAGMLKLRVLQPREADGPVPGILWIHGGGYLSGGSYMVEVSIGKMLARRYGAVVVSPAYRLAAKAPYPAALEDCYAAMEWMYAHAEELGIDRTRIVVGGESAGGGLAVAVCLYARDNGDIPIALQLPLYPMLDCEDTPSSADNHGLVWDTRRNHLGWRYYLGDLYGTDSVPKYASPSRETDYAGLPPCYTYVLDGEPFYCETITYIQHLQDAGIDARVDVYHGNIHGFDSFLFWQEQSRQAKDTLCEEYVRLLRLDE